MKKILRSASLDSDEKATSLEVVKVLAARDTVRTGALTVQGSHWDVPSPLGAISEPFSP